MAFDPTEDIRAAAADGGDPVTLPDGSVVSGIPSLATAEDALNGDMIYPGRTRVLRFPTADVSTLEETQLLTWGGKSWKVIRLQLAAKGALTRAFLGAP